VVVPPVDHDCSLRDIVVAMSNKIAKLEHELGQLRKAHIGPKSERSKMPRVPTTPPTPEQRLAKFGTGWTRPSWVRLTIAQCDELVEMGWLERRVVRPHSFGMAVTEYRTVEQGEV